ncbi:MAG: hypothetical protein H0W15_11265 [Gemmatimonadales bacterium]|nr:hypothetical protein [Gemmatimonadales bacterium]
MPYARLTALIALALALALLGSCNFQQVNRTLVPASAVATLDHKSPFLKAHLRDGTMYVLGQWNVDSTSNRIQGTGALLGVNRDTLQQGLLSIGVASVALFETNVVRGSGAKTALTVMTGITAAVAGFCLTNPKACFGSCPTFYIADSTGQHLQAEGFSASIAPALEATDLDALWHAQGTSRTFDVQMKNEAFETHVVRHVDVLAVPRPKNGRVVVDDGGTFHAATAITAPVMCRGAEGDCLPAVRNFDGEYRLSTTDSTDLAAREVVELSFPTRSGQQGLILATRQSLLSTFVLYQGLAYLGTEAAPLLARLDAGIESPMVAGIGKVLGRIEVQVPDAEGGWITVGMVGETGPLATDTKVVPLPVQHGTTRVRLRMTQGLWRLDWIALANLAPAAAAVRLEPTVVMRDGRKNMVALATFRSRSAAVTSMPGDEYTLRYQLPAPPKSLELFLEARGYYLEWMRQEWLAEEDHGKATRFLLDPAAMMRALAPAYKSQEAEMDAIFWGSAYVRH